MISIPWLAPDSLEFPPVEQALEEPNGLLAAGGDLDPERLIAAYQQGIFPWFSEGEPILWWSPAPRTIIYTNQIHISKSLRKTLNKKKHKITFDKDFSTVIDACSAPRNKQDGDTWITPEMKAAYSKLHQRGIAHSVEVWEEEMLIGGLYGIALGRVFFGESMFSAKSNGSKIALISLAHQLKQWHYRCIDCQVYNDHLASLGAIEVSRKAFKSILADHVQGVSDHWQIK